MGVRVAYPGALGAFTQQAALDVFGSEAEYTGFDVWGQAACQVAEGKLDYGVFPIENSSAGAVQVTFQLLSQYPLFIVGEQTEKIVHHLLGVPGATAAGLKKVYSHPQAIAQCHAYLTGRPELQLIPSENTAISARSVAAQADKTCGAIASEAAARAYGLCILERGIQSSDVNTTRFVVVSRKDAPLFPPDKATMVFTVANRVGALARVLTCFAAAGLNMTRIESRPIENQPFRYFFIADFEGSVDMAALNAAMADCREYTEDLRLLGRYRKAGC